MSNVENGYPVPCGTSNVLALRGPKGFCVLFSRFVRPKETHANRMVAPKTSEGRRAKGTSISSTPEDGQPSVSAPPGRRLPPEREGALARWVFLVRQAAGETLFVLSLLVGFHL